LEEPRRGIPLRLGRPREEGEHAPPRRSVVVAVRRREIDDLSGPRLVLDDPAEEAPAPPRPDRRDRAARERQAVLFGLRHASLLGRPERLPAITREPAPGFS